MTICMNDKWHKKVYKRRRDKLPDNWTEIRAEIWKRDNHTCCRCMLHESRGIGLTVHHLIPRIEGGGENPENLITLCKSCHDFAEINDLRTRTEIEASIDLGVEVRELKVVANEDYFERPAWHKYVYGGARRND